MPLRHSIEIPRPSLEEPTFHHTRTRTDGDNHAILPPPPEKRRKRIASRTPSAEDRLAKVPKTQLRNFTGVVEPYVDRKSALYFAKKVYEWPVPETVTDRMVVWTGGFQHEGSGGAGVVWMRAPNGTEAPNSWTTNPINLTALPRTWKVKGLEYPGQRCTDYAVGLFAIAAAIDLALEELEHPFFNTMHHCKPDDKVYNDLSKSCDSRVTESNSHTESKELFVFTDSKRAMEGLRSKKPTQDEEAREHLERIKTLSERGKASGIHLEVHYCRNRQQLFPGKYLASETAKNVTKGRAAHPFDLCN